MPRLKQQKPRHIVELKDEGTTDSTTQKDNEEERHKQPNNNEAYHRNGTSTAGTTSPTTSTSPLPSSDDGGGDSSSVERAYSPVTMTVTSSSPVTTKLKSSQLQHTNGVHTQRQEDDDEKMVANTNVAPGKDAIMLKQEVNNGDLLLGLDGLASMQLALPPALFNPEAAGSPPSGFATARHNAYPTHHHNSNNTVPSLPHKYSCHKKTINNLPVLTTVASVQQQQQQQYIATAAAAHQQQHQQHNNIRHLLRQFGGYYPGSHAMMMQSYVEACAVTQLARQHVMLAMTSPNAAAVAPSLYRHHHPSLPPTAHPNSVHPAVYSEEEMFRLATSDSPASSASGSSSSSGAASSWLKQGPWLSSTSQQRGGGKNGVSSSGGVEDGATVEQRPDVVTHERANSNNMISEAENCRIYYDEYTSPSSQTNLFPKTQPPQSSNGAGLQSNGGNVVVDCGEDDKSGEDSSIGPVPNSMMGGHQQQRKDQYKSHDPENMYIQCHICKKRIKRLYHFHRHMRIHTGEKSHQCPYCHYKSVRKDNLKSHMKTHEKHFKSAANVATGHQQASNVAAAQSKAVQQAATASSAAIASSRANSYRKLTGGGSGRFIEQPKPHVDDVIAPAIYDGFPFSRILRHQERAHFPPPGQFPFDDSFFQFNSMSTTTSTTHRIRRNVPPSLPPGFPDIESMMAEHRHRHLRHHPYPTFNAK